LDPVELEHETEKRPLMDVLHRSKEQRYAFDKIFRNESQDEVIFFDIVRCFRYTMKLAEVS
jgi:hypothetical protein